MCRSLRTFHWLVLAGLYALFGVKAFLVFAPTYDFISYHLPRGLMFFHRTSFIPEQFLLETYKGYPPLPEFLEGLLVVLSGRLSAANGVGMIGMACAIGGMVLLDTTEETLRWFLTFCLAFPLIVLHLTIGYIDLFTGAMLLLGFAGLCGLYRDIFPLRAALIMIVGLSAAMFSKFTAWPPTAALSLFGALFLLRSQQRRRLATAQVCLLLLLLAVGIAFYPLRNLLVWNNPTYPVRLELPFLETLPGDMEAVPTEDVPPYLAKSSAPVRFVHSVLELNRRWGTEPYTWNYDQYAGPQSSHQRMGGWFFLSVLVVALLLVIGALSGAIPRPLFAAHVVSAIVIAVIPRYFELRYALFVPLNSLVLLTSFGSRLPRSVRLSGAMALTLCGGYVLWSLRSSAFSFDLRPPERFAPKEARAFWRSEIGKTHTSPVTIGIHDPDAIFWAGPTFSEIPVKVISDEQ
jgi:hypothetical protein